MITVDADRCNCSVRYQIVYGQSIEILKRIYEYKIIDSIYDSPRLKLY